MRAIRLLACERGRETEQYRNRKRKPLMPPELGRGQYSALYARVLSSHMLLITFFFCCSLHAIPPPPSAPTEGRSMVGGLVYATTGCTAYVVRPLLRGGWRVPYLRPRVCALCSVVIFIVSIEFVLRCLCVAVAAAAASAEYTCVLVPSFSSFVHL